MSRLEERKLRFLNFKVRETKNWTPDTTRLAEYENFPRVPFFVALTFAFPVPAAETPPPKMTDVPPYLPLIDAKSAVVVAIAFRGSPAAAIAATSAESHHALPIRRDGVECGARLVQQQDLRVHRQGTRNT